MPVIKNPTTVIKSGGGEDKLAYRISNLGNYSYENNEITSFKQFAFYFDDNLTEISCNKVASIGDNAFQNCSALVSASFPAAIGIGSNTFRYCAQLTSASFPLVTNIGGSAFQGCSRLTTTTFPLVTNIGNNAFMYCSQLTTVSFPAAKTISSNAFDGCTALTSITLGANQVCTLGATNAIPASSSHHVNIYVPVNLVASYRTATNWSTLYNNGYISFLPIDGQLINTSITNGTFSGPVAIANNGTATITITANSGYELPTSVSVTGASYTYSNGVITLSNPTAEVNISATCPQATPSGYSVSVASFGSSPYGMGRAYYSLDDGSTWVEITGAGTLTTSATQIKFKAEDDSAGAQESVEIISSTLGLSIESSPSNNGEAVSSNYTLSSNVADIQIIFHDND